MHLPIAALVRTERRILGMIGSRAPAAQPELHNRRSGPISLTGVSQLAGGARPPLDVGALMTIIATQVGHLAVRA